MCCLQLIWGNQPANSLYSDQGFVRFFVSVTRTSLADGTLWIGWCHPKRFRVETPVSKLVNNCSIENLFDLDPSFETNLTRSIWLFLSSRLKLWTLIRSLNANRYFKSGTKIKNFVWDAIWILDHLKTRLVLGSKL